MQYECWMHLFYKMSWVCCKYTCFITFHLLNSHFPTSSFFRSYLCYRLFVCFRKLNAFCDFVFPRFFFIPFCFPFHHRNLSVMNIYTYTHIQSFFLPFCWSRKEKEEVLCGFTKCIQHFSSIAHSFHLVVTM